jgi:hypothetical protein
MTIERTPYQQQPEFDDLEKIPLVDFLLIRLLYPVLWLYGIFVMPFRTKGQVTTTRAISFSRITPEEDAAIPVPVRAFLESAEAQAAHAGFHEPIRHAKLERATPGPYLTIMPSRAGDTMFAAFGSHHPRRLTITGAALQTRLADGTLIRTSNEGIGSGPQRGPSNFDDVTFAEMKDIARLCDIHRKRVTRAVAAGGVPIPVGWSPPATHPLELMQRAADEGIDAALEFGRIEPPATVEVRFTLKGAALSAWSLHWPVRQFADWSDRRRAARLLRELG